MKPLFSLLALGLLLGGCSWLQSRPEGQSRVGAILERDLTRAAEIAVTGKDEAGAKCFTYLASVVKESGAADVDSVGLFSRDFSLIFLVLMNIF